MIITILTHIVSFVSPFILEKKYSTVNGSIVVEYAFGTKRIRVGGYIQSGRYAEKILQYIFHRITIPIPNRILVLGVGGGSMIMMLHKLYPDAQITAVDIDPTIVSLGKKYLGLSEKNNSTIHIQDAIQFIKKDITSYDLIIDDLFVACDRPLEADDTTYYETIKRLLSIQGIYIANRSMLPRYKEQTLFVFKNLATYLPYTVSLPRPPNFFIIGSKHPLTSAP